MGGLRGNFEYYPIISQQAGKKQEKLILRRKMNGKEWRGGSRLVGTTFPVLPGRSNQHGKGQRGLSLDSQPNTFLSTILNVLMMAWADSKAPFASSSVISVKS